MTPVIDNITVFGVVLHAHHTGARINSPNELILLLNTTEFLIIIYILLNLKSKVMYIQQ